ncbi:MAG: DUF4070 domain-containing protein [Candidatus Eisenbacteria bacterium]|nr:DUF4070 domain-containing protein [Candidatus Eisenbacteria bacterium]
MNALLIYPKSPETFWSLTHALRLINRKAASPPLGLLTVAAMLPSDWDLRLVDLNVRDMTDEDLAWADYALLSGMIVQRDSALDVAARCKSAGLTVVAGGPLFASEDERARFGDVDHFVLNEAELTLPPFLEDLERGVSHRTYRTDQFADLTTSPAPRWDLVDPHEYASRGVQFSRGCPNNCEFCEVTQLLGHRWRRKAVSQVIAELDTLYDLGWRGVVPFVDDNFNARGEYLRRELLPALIEWREGKRGMGFSAQVTMELADDTELIELMVRAGFGTVFIGIETMDEVNLAECHKRQNRHRDLLSDIKRIQRAGLQVQAGFIVGFDNDTPSVFQRMTEFIQKSGIATAMVGLLQAPVGTALYKRLNREGRIRVDLSGDNSDGSTNIVPRMGLESLQAGYGNLLRDLYAPKNYYRRVRTFLREYRPRRANTRITPSQILAVIRSFYHLSVVGRERWEYPGLLFWTLFRRPRALPVAVVLAIYGYHYRMCFEPLFSARVSGPGRA